jgi:hypothetical protein
MSDKKRPREVLESKMLARESTGMARDLQSELPKRDDVPSRLEAEAELDFFKIMAYFGSGLHDIKSSCEVLARSRPWLSNYLYRRPELKPYFEKAKIKHAEKTAAKMLEAATEGLMQKLKTQTTTETITTTNSDGSSSVVVKEKELPPDTLLIRSTLEKLSRQFSKDVNQNQLANIMFKYLNFLAKEHRDLVEQLIPSIKVFILTQGTDIKNVDDTDDADDIRMLDTDIE